MLIAALVTVVVVLAAMSGLLTAIARGSMWLLTITGFFVPGRGMVRVALTRARLDVSGSAPATAGEPATRTPAPHSSQLA
jgi:hypothetical protein